MLTFILQVLTTVRELTLMKHSGECLSVPNLGAEIAEPA